MGLARVYSSAGLGQTIIRQLGDVGGPIATRVNEELDRLYAWAKDAKRNIKRDVSVVGNVGAGLDVLHTFSLDTPNRLSTNGDYLDVWYAGFYAANDTNKRVNAFFGGTAYENIGVTLDFDGGADTGWVIAARIIRLSSTSVLCSSIWASQTWFGDSANAGNGGGIGGGTAVRNKSITGLSDLGANATTMEVKGEGAANDDVVQNLSIIELFQQ